MNNKFNALLNELKKEKEKYIILINYYVYFEIGY